MTADDIKRQLQSILGDGLAVVVGCGLSSAEGLPNMGDLATALDMKVPVGLPAEISPSWQDISSTLATGAGLEAALSGKDLHEDLMSRIVLETAKLFRSKERSVINDVLSNKIALRFTLLVKILSPSQSSLSIITTNYDRLIELACESAGYAIDCMFTGSLLGRFDQKESAYSFCRGIRRRQGKLTLDYAPRLKIFKPHGSLDWYRFGSNIVRCPVDVDLLPLIIPPGNMKYRSGYDEPFDAHREYANREIDRAQRYLVIGYGFNDAHLQTHLVRNLVDGKICLLVTRELTEAASEMIRTCPNVMALTADPADHTKSVFRNFDGELTSLDGALWDLGILSREVFA